MKIKLDTGQTFEGFGDTTLLAVLQRNNVWLTASCGGKGVCGKCKVKILEGKVVAPSGHGKISEADLQSGYVLACKVYPQSDILVAIPLKSRLVVGDKIAQGKAEEMQRLFKSLCLPIEPLTKRLHLTIAPPSLTNNTADLDRLRHALAEHGLEGMCFSHDFVLSLPDALRQQAWDVGLIYTEQEGALPQAIALAKNTSRNFGLAIDIGTTTLVVSLVNLETAEILDTGSTYNSQMRYGDDVITRIVHAVEGGGLSELQKAVVSDINTITQTILNKHQIEPNEVSSVSIAGNTVMTQLFWGINPAFIREEPYIPTVNKFPIWQAKNAGLNINPQAPVFSSPCMASYVGGDITAGILATGMHKRSEIALFMDIGTNGEIAIGNSDWIMTAACSAGPCFEGSGIHSGMRATPGAIEAVSIDKTTKKPLIKVIAGESSSVSPLGICGSGMIDALCEMFLNGIIDPKGKLIAGSSPNVIEGEHALEFVLYEDSLRRIVLTEPDIDNLIRAKSAIYSGICTLLTEAGLELEAIDRVYIAGGFGGYLNIQKAIVLGMLPDMPLEKFEYKGNTSLIGAYLSLVSSSLRKELDEIASKMTYIELSVSSRFMDEYVSSLFLPHTDINRFPTVKQLLTSSNA